MSDGQEATLLTEVESLLKQRFNKEESDKKRVPSTARAAGQSARIDQLTLPDGERGKMPFTKDKYLVRENPHKVAWEREVRKFLRRLSPEHGHRVSAVMVYEWATGIKVVDLMEHEREHPGEERPSWRSDLRKINEIMRYYFGKGKMTWIMGKKVLNCYRVPPGWYVKRHRPMTLTLYSEYLEGSLNP